MSESVITRKGQVTIPKEIREHLKAKEGEKVLFVMRGEEVVLKVVRGNVLDLRGSVRPTKRPADFNAIRRAVKRAVSSRVARHG